MPPTSNPRIASRNAVCLPPSCHFCKTPPLQTGILPQSVVRWQLARRGPLEAAEGGVPRWEVVNKGRQKEEHALNSPKGKVDFKKGVSPSPLVIIVH